MSDTDSLFESKHRNTRLSVLDGESTRLLNGQKAPIAEEGEEEDDYSLKNYFKNWNWATFKKRVPYYIPVLAWLPKYTRKDFFYDFISGMTVSFVLIPQGLGLASLAFLPPIYGLYTAFVPLLIYSLLGTSKHLQVGPEAAVSLMTGQVLLSVSPDNHDAFPELAHTIAFFVGVFALVAGVLRLGFLDSILSKAMASGFITAVAIVIMSEQLLTLFGVTEHMEDESSSTVEKVIFFFEHIHLSNPATVALGLSGLAFLFVFNFIRNRKMNNLFFKFFPFVLFLVLLSIILTWQLRLDEKGVVILGEITGGFQTPGQLSFEHAGSLISGSLLIMIIGFIESVVCTKRFAEKNGYSISDNRELVALGTSNMLGGIFGAYPAFGALSRTNLNDAVGGRTQVVSLVAAAVILFTILFFLPLFYYLPKCIMAAVVFYAGFGLLEVENLKFLWKVRAFVDIVLFFMTFIITLAVSIQVGILVSIGVSLVSVVKEVSGPTFNVIGRSAEGKYRPLEDGSDVRMFEDIIIVRFKDSLFFAKIGFLRDRFRRVEKFRTLYAHPSDQEEPLPLIGIIIDISRMRSIDASALKVLGEIVKDYVGKGVRVCFVKLTRENRNKFKKSGITDAVGEQNFFPKIQDAVDAISGNSLRSSSIKIEEV